MLDNLKNEKYVNRYKALNTTGACKVSQMRIMFCNISIEMLWFGFNVKGALMRKAFIKRGILSSLKEVVSKPYMINDARMAAMLLDMLA